MRSRITRAESLLLALCALLLLAAVFGPPVAQPALYHAFADQRTLWGVPHALDVLSNLPFALAGGAGLWLLRPAAALPLTTVQRACAVLFFAGLVLTALCSAGYHLHPDDAGLAVDRAAMTVAFAGLLGLLLAAHVSNRAGALFAVAVLLLAPVTIAIGLRTGNVLPWGVVQGGGLLLMLVFGLRSPQAGAPRVRWAAVIAAYALAKLLEAGDHEVFAASAQWLSGHTLKHIVAALAAWPVLAGLATLRPVQNQAASAAALRA